MPLVTRVLEYFKKHKVILIPVLLFVLLEALFDIIEVTIGQLMLWSNERRPKVGRLWTEEERDQQGQRQALSRIDSLRQTPEHLRYIHTLDDLVAFLAYKSNLWISRNDFLAIYRNLPAEEAARLIDPFILKDLADNSAWYSVRLNQAEQKLILLFSDPFGQPLLDQHVYLDPNSRKLLPPRLQADPDFQGRIVDREVFIRAFENLPIRLQLQIVNDPHKWAAWEPRLLQVGISPVVKDGAVLMTFEVAASDSTQLVALQASEMAAAYLVTAINATAPQTYGLSLPAREVSHE